MELVVDLIFENIFFTFNVTHLLKLINHETNFLFLPLPSKFLLNLKHKNTNCFCIIFDFSALNLIEQVALVKIQTEIESAIKKIESVKVVLRFDMAQRILRRLFAVHFLITHIFAPNRIVDS